MAAYQNLTCIKNCTPHAIVVVCDGENVTFEPSGIIPRVDTVEKEAEFIFLDEIDIPCVNQSTGAVSGLPEIQDGVFLIVSGMVFAASDRKDIIAPDTGKTAIRNERGQIVAVTRFLRK